MKNRIWFPAKRYGWGWGPPVCWQGWMVLAVYIVSVVLCAVFLLHDRVLHAACIIGSTAILVVLCWIKGEKPKWRWGGKDD